MIYQNTVAAPREELSDLITEGATNADQFVGLRILPPAPSKQLTLHVPKITIAQGDLMRATGKKRTPGANFDRRQGAIGDLTATLQQVGEEVLLPDEITLTYEDYFAVEAFYAKDASDRLLRSHEMDVAATVFNTGNFTAKNSLTAYTQANIATMSPVEDILAAIRVVKGLGEAPNTLVIPGIVYDRIRVCTDMRNFVAGSVNPGARVTGNTIQMAFESHGIKNVLIPDAYVNQSELGANANINSIWGTAYIGVLNCQPGQLLAGGIGRTFYWEKEGPLFNIQSYRDEPKKSNVIRALKSTLPSITNSRAGTLIGTQYA
jgi:hypothetical protein